MKGKTAPDQSGLGGGAVASLMPALSNNSVSDASPGWCCDVFQARTNGHSWKAPFTTQLNGCFPGFLETS